MLSLQVVGQQYSYPPEIEGTKVEIYKTVGDIDLRLWIFNPPKHHEKDQRPAIVFFFGGGWRAGSPIQFTEHCKYLAARGMVAITADYRVSSRHSVKAVDCVADAKSAIRWIRKNAEQLGIDPNRIAVGGGSAGGHLAAATATLSGFEEDAEQPTISSTPDALVLFNPAVVLASIPGQYEMPADRQSSLEERAGIALTEISPYHHIRPDMPPTIIFHGTGDTTVAYETVRWFQEAMVAKGNRCDLVGYEDAEHGFFNYGRDENAAFIDTVARMDTFLVSLGFLKAPPKVRE